MLTLIAALVLAIAPEPLMGLKVDPAGGCSGPGRSSPGGAGEECACGIVSEATGSSSESWPATKNPFICCQYRPLRVLPEEPESTTTRLAARRIGGGSCCGEVGPGDAVEIRKAAQAAHTHTECLMLSQKVRSVPGVISQWQWSQHIKEDSLLKGMLAVGSWMRKIWRVILCALCKGWAFLSVDRFRIPLRTFRPTTR